MKELNILAGNATTNLPQREILLNTKEQDMKVLDTLVEHVENKVTNESI